MHTRKGAVSHSLLRVLHFQTNDLIFCSLFANLCANLSGQLPCDNYVIIRAGSPRILFCFFETTNLSIVERSGGGGIIIDTGGVAQRARQIAFWQRGILDLAMLLYYILRFISNRWKSAAVRPRNRSSMRRWKWSLSSVADSPTTPSNSKVWGLQEAAGWSQVGGFG